MRGQFWKASKVHWTHRNVEGSGTDRLNTPILTADSSAGTVIDVGADVNVPSTRTACSVRRGCATPTMLRVIAGARNLSSGCRRRDLPTGCIWNGRSDRRYRVCTRHRFNPALVW